MRILVYGAGVIGCLLAHNLCKGKNEVTLLARGEWKDTIDKNGLIIKHSGYLHKTVDRIRTIEKIEKNDGYDLIFVTMQYSQTLNILKGLSENISSNIVFVGNNIKPDYCEEEVLRYASKEKAIAFGFQGSGGYRESNRVVSMHNFKIDFTIGGLNNGLPIDFVELINSAFEKTSYRINYQDNMEAWLLCHAAHILPGCYLCYAYDGDLKKASREDAEMSAVATGEAHRMLKSLGYPICPSEEEYNYNENLTSTAKKLHLIYKTIVGKFVISNHCKNAVNEMTFLDKSFNDLRKKTDVKMAVWDELRSNAILTERCFDVRKEIK